ncbi:MAG: sigma-70 family RNA polymerase sigma factor [Candidatus Aminicenantales bacterium]|jgi:RNA polymerase sigma-70 factor (ECF subfamily)
MGAPVKPHEHPEDAVVVRKAQEGDVDAFESLVREYQQMIYALCRRLTGAHQSADDLAQETFIKAYFALPKFDSRWPFYPWLRKIAVNTSLNYLKSRSRERPLLDEAMAGRRDDSRPAQDLPQARLEQAEFEEKFRRAVASLPDEQKTVFVLRFDEGLSYEEISRTLDLPQGTVMSRLNRARQKLKALLADSLERRA